MKPGAIAQAAGFVGSGCRRASVSCRWQSIEYGLFFNQMYDKEAAK